MPLPDHRPPKTARLVELDSWNPQQLKLQLERRKNLTNLSLSWLPKLRLVASPSHSLTDLERRKQVGDFFQLEVFVSRHLKRLLTAHRMSQIDSKVAQVPCQCIWMPGYWWIVLNSWIVPCEKYRQMHGCTMLHGNQWRVCWVNPRV